jgi:GxxExxY protein
MILLNEDLLFKNECYHLVGIGMRIHSMLGKGFKELVYKDALEIEFKLHNIPYEREKPFNIKYGSEFLRHRFAADFVVYNSILLEIKAAHNLYLDNFRQTLNYLKASKIQLGILMNFGEERLNFKRIVCSY